jgi:1,4-alpha-glucan branching enzyme
MTKKCCYHTQSEYTGKGGIMSIKKQYLKNKPVCKVTFRLPTEATGSARSVHVLGDFNGWDPFATPMRRLKKGGFTVSVNLETNREYQFRYLIDESRWENDWCPDRYIPSPFPYCDNSVVIV